jgi:ribonuclease inhibitor
MVVLDGETLSSPADVYARLGAAVPLPRYFGYNPDALWDVLTEYPLEDVEIIWRHSARSADRLGAEFGQIVEVLSRAAEAGLLSFRLA